MKKNNCIYIILTLILIIFIPIFFSYQAHAEGEKDVLTLTKIEGTTVDRPYEIKQLGSQKNIYVAEYSYGIGLVKELVFKGSLIDETAKIVKVETNALLGTGNQVMGTFDETSGIEQDGNQYSITFNRQTYNAPIILSVTVNYQNQDYQYVLAFVSSAKAGYDAYLKDAITNEIFEDNYFVKNKTRVLQVLTVSDTTEVSVELLRESTKDAKYNGTRLNWLEDSENYIRINGGQLQRFNGSGERLGENWSPSLPLQSGINIVEVFVEKWDNRCFVSNTYVNSLMKEGINLLNSRIFNSNTKGYMVYIIDNTGKGIDKITTNSDTSLKKIEATQLGGVRVPLTQYNVGTDEETNQMYIALPENLPTDGEEVFNKILLGLIPTDPNAKVEIMDTDENNPVVVGAEVGIYHSVYVTKADGSYRDSINVKVTASDGTEQIHTIGFKFASSDCTVNNMTFTGGTLKDYSSKEAVSFNPETKTYLLQHSGDVKVKVDAADNTTVFINGKKQTANEDGTYTISASDMATIVKVVAQDGLNNVSYYFVTEDEKGNTPLYGQTEDTKKKIDYLLTGWNNRSEEERKTLVSSDDGYIGAWAIYQSRATKVDIRNATTYDVTKTTYNQATDWARDILELIMIGENPYNYNGKNLVEGLKACSNGSGTYGPFACNIWSLMAFKALGEQPKDYDKLVAVVKAQAENKSFDKDMRAWAIATIADLLTPEEVLPIALSLKETQNADGLWGNSYTNGCQLSAIGATGINIEYFNTADTTVLDAYTKNYFDPEIYKFTYASLKSSYQKDAIIGLGDLLYGRSVYTDYKLTNEKVQSLLDAAGKLDTSNATDEQKATLTSAMEALEAVKSDKAGYGDEYYALYVAMGAISDEYNEHIKLCTVEEGKAIDTLMEDITNNCELDKLTIQSGSILTDIQKRYDALGKDDETREARLKGYVLNADKIVPAVEAFNKLEEEYIADVNKQIEDLGNVEDLTLDKKDAVKALEEKYDALNKAQKKQISNDIVNQAVSKIEILTVEDLLTKLPAVDAVKASDEEQIVAVREAYDSLSKSQRAKLSQDLVTALIQSEDKLEAVKVEPMLSALTKKSSVKDIEAARRAYDALTKNQKKLVSEAAYKNLQEVEEYVGVSGLSLNHTAASLLVGKSVQLKASVVPSNATTKAVTFKSSNTAVATVSKTGKVTAKKIGSATISAVTTDGNKKASCKVYVTKALAAKVSAQTTSSVTLKWTKVSGSKGYKVYQYDTKTKKYNLVKTVSAKTTSYKVSKLKAGTAYKFQVVSYMADNGKDITVQSNKLSTATKPAKSSKVTVKKASKTTAKVTWKKVTGATGYKVYMATSKKGSYKLMATVKGATKVTYTKKDLKKNKTYYFKVRAYKTVNGKNLYGAYTSVVKVKM